MIVTYLRSSSMGTWAMCQFQYYIEYVLGIRPPSGRAAQVGHVVHKTFELIARWKLAQQNNKSVFVDPETDREFPVNELDRRFYFDFSYNHYSQLPDSELTPGDLDICWNMVSGVVKTNNGEYCPSNQEIVQPEQFFDLTIDEPWAWYKFENPHSPDTKLVGQIEIKGAVDLITRVGPGIIQYTDWKTGRRWDWVNNVEKTYDKLMSDTQMLLYYYALRRLYPNDTVMMMIYFVKDGGPFFLPYTEQHFLEAKRRIRDVFWQIRECETPNRVREVKGMRWGSPCRFCKHEKSGLCDELWDKIQTLGTDRVTVLYGKKDAVQSYGGGGGIANRDV